MENLSHGGSGYIAERSRRAWEVGRARFAIAFDNRSGKKSSNPSQLPLLYIFEALGIELRKAMEKYMPRPYGGDVLLFRASKQLPGLDSDEFLGWKRVLHGNVEVCEIPGRQQNLMLEPNVSRLSKELSSRLNAAQQRNHVEERKRTASMNLRGVMFSA
jgi:thioesterase domain-containing protein